MTHSSPKFGGLQVGITVLTLATAIIHLIVLNRDSVHLFFALNGLGYLVLLTALYALPRLASSRPLIRWILLAFTVITIVGWIVVGEKSGVLPYLTKAIEVALVVLLYLESRQPSGQG